MGLINKKQYVTAFGLICVVVTIYFSRSSANPFSGGNGRPSNPFLISEPNHLLLLGGRPDLLEKHFCLMCDIDMNVSQTNSIRFHSAVIAPDLNELAGFQGRAFSGTFDGKGFAIRGLNFKIGQGQGADYIGLFGMISEEAKIVNLALDNLEIDGEVGCYIGGIAGSNRGYIANCSVKGKISIKSGNFIGGLIGKNSGCTERSSANCVLVCGKAQGVGGLVGENDFGTIRECFCSGSLYGADTLGGLIGNNAHGNIVRNHSIMDVSGNFIVGGLIGMTANSSISQCLAQGKVFCQEPNQCGGLVYESQLDAINSCFWNKESSGIEISDGGVGLSQAEIGDIQTYLLAGWDFVNERANGTSNFWMMSIDQNFPVIAVLTDNYQRPSLVGNGTEIAPYLLGTPEDLGAVSHYDQSACYRLISHIDLNGIVWNGPVIEECNGKFDGNGKIISNLVIHGAGQIGFFGKLSESAEVKNLGILDAGIKIKGYSKDVGVFVSQNHGVVHTSFAVGSVSCMEGVGYIGGFVGTNKGFIKDCYARGDVLAEKCRFNGGGFLGGDFNGLVQYCYSTSILRGYRLVFTPGSIPLLSGFGGISDRINMCYYLDYEQYGSDSAFPLNEMQIKQQASYKTWDFKDTWWIAEGIDSPRLYWERE